MVVFYCVTDNNLKKIAFYEDSLKNFINLNSQILVVAVEADQRNRGEVSAACLKGLGCVENL